jgi:transitional endoplasmic reticulum ATPase
MNNNKFAFRVIEASKKDAGQHIVRLDKRDLNRFEIEPGEFIRLSAQKQALARVELSPTYHRDLSQIQMDGILRENAGVGLDELVHITKEIPPNALKIIIRPLKSDTLTRIHSMDQILRSILNLPLMMGNRFRVRNMGSGFRLYEVVDADPKTAVVITAQTQIEVLREETEIPEKHKTGITYEDIGGLWEEIQRIREMIELPFKHPEIFDRLGIDPPKGVLLHGPPGTGKTLIAKAVANEANIHFISVNGPEIVNKFYGESEAQLRNLFEEARKKAPSILFLDEIDAIAPKRTEVTGEVEKRIVSQLLALMDGLKSRGEVIVIGATNIPNVIDPALRRPGRFDREIATKIPDKQARLEILQIHTTGMPLTADVDLKRLSDITHGFVGADLESICREAALYRLRCLMESTNLLNEECFPEISGELFISMEDFMHALKIVEPSAIREVFVEIPEIRWDDVGGLKEVKSRLQKTIEWPILYQEIYNQYNCPQAKGILLTGPPGTGKTMLAKALATETQRNFIAIKGPELLSKWVGESEKGVREVFRKARIAAPSIVFFDEIDALIPRRSSAQADSGLTEKVISQFLTEMDGIEILGDVIIIAATNRPDLLDPAILRAGRFDMILELDLPNRDDREQIFSVHTKGLPLEETVDMNEFIDLTDGFAGSGIAWLCGHALRLAIEEYIQDHMAKAIKAPFLLKVQRNHFLMALKNKK